MRLDPLRLGLAFGILWAFGVAFLACMARLFGWGVPVVEIIASVYIGFSITWAGLLAGVLWGLADGFIGGFLIAWLYNLLLPTDK
ncbi:MAG: bacteriophage holin [Nitrospinaceae bacterium]|jgi:hypothetical protein|nr:bacteriophage holin [Nitrospinaceae bacterium]MBT3435027.1 bacteriophage holin [Nitrospinaceae bacterium]MBT3823146.1 bacteriophage holin [Nitrospinaceae bacterium]MBT4093829.1 bacteriophage holin [Nitrospinaceae bacterium]MBT4432703.1 bacteriophage holin [Nitrospinaceae bacterium]